MTRAAVVSLILPAPGCQVRVARHVEFGRARTVSPGRQAHWIP